MEGTILLLGAVEFDHNLGSARSNVSPFRLSPRRCVFIARCNWESSHVELSATDDLIIWSLRRELGQGGSSFLRVRSATRLVHLVRGGGGNAHDERDADSRMPDGHLRMVMTSSRTCTYRLPRAHHRVGEQASSCYCSPTSAIDVM